MAGNHPLEDRLSNIDEVAVFSSIARALHHREYGVVASAIPTRAVGNLPLESGRQIHIPRYKHSTTRYDLEQGIFDHLNRRSTPISGDFARTITSTLNWGEMRRVFWGMMTESEQHNLPREVVGNLTNWEKVAIYTAMWSYGNPLDYQSARVGGTKIITRVSVDQDKRAQMESSLLYNSQTGQPRSVTEIVYTLIKHGFSHLSRQREKKVAEEMYDSDLQVPESRFYGVKPAIRQQRLAGDVLSDTTDAILDGSVSPSVTGNDDGMVKIGAVVAQLTDGFTRAPFSQPNGRHHVTEPRNIVQCGEGSRPFTDEEEADIWSQFDSYLAEREKYPPLDESDVPISGLGVEGPWEDALAVRLSDMPPALRNKLKRSGDGTDGQQTLAEYTSLGPLFEQEVGDDAVTGADEVYQAELDFND